MCGLFGMLRSPIATHPDRASAVLVMLGEFAEERGLDAAGVAFLNGDVAAAGRVHRPGTRLLRCPDVQTSGWRVAKGCVPFTRLWKRGFDGDLRPARLVLGHTRWATQGNARHLANASPLLVGGLVGTHNGDVDAAPLRAAFRLPRSVGATDSEVIFQALARTDEPLQVLAALRGRAALAWADLADSSQVHLARAALSPLAVAMDAEENLYWASNPAWLRSAADRAGARLLSLRLLAEGTLTTLSARPRMRVVARQRFVATARRSDLHLSRAIWRGFEPEDLAADHGQRRHKVADTPRWARTG